VEETFKTCLVLYCETTISSSEEAATVLLEWGLAQHHFDRPGQGKKSFDEARKRSGLEMLVTGSIGKRTKFQQKATAQMVVRAKSTAVTTEPPVSDDAEHKDAIKGQLVKHSEEEILLERINFEDDHDNTIHALNILDQSILLALCLDVKNNNPSDGLTSEQMGAFLARVLDHHDDWMVYSTALLERSWLEFERSHARERAILQMQALADQHTNRLTITQSTRKSIEDSAPVQDRLSNLHIIVYPPRWLIIQDLAERYAAMGIVTSAAELFTAIELWDSVVDCYRRAGRVSFAEKVVRERLAIEETPRMWAALGDLTKDPSHYEKAIELSNGRFGDAFLALAEYHFDKGDMSAAADNFERALKVRPLNPSAWFRLGTISMQMNRWQSALRASSEVVMQEPEEADAWANIAAVHMHNKQPAEAYPALNEALKQKRSNWRVWVSKLYTCLDLGKYDEAIQACNVLLDLRVERKASEGVPFLEEKVVRAIVGGSLQSYQTNRDNQYSHDASRRTLQRVHALLDRISSSSDSADQPWIFETIAFFKDHTGQDAEAVLELLVQEYRSLQTISGWEKDNLIVRKLSQVVLHMTDLYRRSGKDGIIKAKYTAQGVLQKLKIARPNETDMPDEATRLANVLEGLEKELDNWGNK
jgi:tetratricopeptide (TPR) repeat protein